MDSLKRSEEIHFEKARLGVKSAWSIALVLAENLKSSDYSKLNKKFDTLPTEQHEEMMFWLKDFPEQSSIAKNGRNI